jgi:hypothetical protein
MMKMNHTRWTLAFQWTQADYPSLLRQPRLINAVGLPRPRFSAALPVGAPLLHFRVL